MNISDYNFVDFSDAFEDSGIRKRLLTQMGLFQPYGHSSPDFSFDINLGNDQNNADPVMRHGSEWDYTVRSLAKLQNMELPHWAFQDAVRPAMWQGKRRPGSAEKVQQRAVPHSASEADSGLPRCVGRSGASACAESLRQPQHFCAEESQ